MFDSMLDLIWRIFLLVLQDEKVLLQGKSLSTHCMKSVFIRSFSGPYFSVFGLNMERYSYLSVFSPNTGKYGPEKLQIRTIFTLWQSHNIYSVRQYGIVCQFKRQISNFFLFKCYNRKAWRGVTVKKLRKPEMLRWVSGEATLLT